MTDKKTDNSIIIKDDMDDLIQSKSLVDRIVDYRNINLSNEYKPAITLGRPSGEMASDSCLTSFYSPLSSCSLAATSKFLGYPALAELAQEPLIRAGIEVIADEMTRKFIKITSTDDEDSTEKIKALEKELKKYKIRKLFNQAGEMCGFHGGCLIYIKTDDTDLTSPLTLDPATFGEGKLKGFKIIEPINVYPGKYNATDPIADDYFNPETWYVMGKEYHKSRFLYFTNNEVPLVLKPVYNFFGIPTSQLALDFVKEFADNRKSAQRLLNKFSLTFIKTNLTAQLNGKAWAEINKRIKRIAKERDNDSIVTIDKDKEDISQINTPLSGITDIVQMSLELLSVVFHMPHTKYLGNTPKGLNATGDGERKNFYDYIHSQQEKIFGDSIETVLKILQLNKAGEINEYITYEFEQLEEHNEREAAEINQIEANTAALYIDKGVVDSSEVRERLADDEDSGYSNIDTDKVIDMPEQDNSDLFNFDEDSTNKESKHWGYKLGIKIIEFLKSLFLNKTIFDSKFKEEDHPRDEEGKFGAGGSSSNSENPQDISSLLGEEYIGYKGQEAIDKLLAEKQGHVKGAFNRDDIGSIDLLWGDDNNGMQHIVKSRKEQGFSDDKLKNLFSDITNVIENGSLKVQDNGRFYIQQGKNVAIVSPELKGNKITFLLTSFKTRK